MIVVLDTNALIQALNPQNPLSVILTAWHAGRFQWAVSTDVLLEYQEIVTRRSGAERWRTLERLLDLAHRYGTNLIYVSPSFYFRTISDDQDDDKFADAAITINADFIVTSDSHFRPLVGSGYRPQPISPINFIAQFLT